MRVTSDVLPLLSAIRALHRDVEAMREELAVILSPSHTQIPVGMHPRAGWASAQLLPSRAAADIWEKR